MKLLFVAMTIVSFLTWHINTVSKRDHRNKLHPQSYDDLVRFLFAMTYRGMPTLFTDLSLSHPYERQASNPI